MAQSFGTLGTHKHVLELTPWPPHYNLLTPAYPQQESRGVMAGRNSGHLLFLIYLPSLSVWAAVIGTTPG